MTLAYEEIGSLIDTYLRRMSNDHHKIRDGYFSIECVWDGWKDEVTKPKFVAVHGGYINELIGEPKDTFEEAVEDMREFLIECIAEYKEEDWGWDEN